MDRNVAFFCSLVSGLVLSLEDIFSSGKRPFCFSGRSTLCVEMVTVFICRGLGKV